MPRPRRSKTYSFDTDIIEYQRSFLDDLDFTRAGNVFLKSEEGESIDFNFVWARSRSIYTRHYRHREGFEEFFGTETSNEGIDGFNFVEFQLRSEPDNIFYLALPKNFETNPFIDLDDAIVVSRTSDPTTDNNIFNQLIAPGYELDYVQEVDLDLNENLEEEESAVSIPESSTEYEQVELELNENLESQKSLESTPEPSAISGMVLLGILFVGIIGKRAVSKLRSRLRTGN